MPVEAIVPKGVANLLEAAGIPCIRGDGYTWKDSLPQNGWVKIQVRPEDAPPGSVIVYDRDPPGKRGKAGGTAFGHVEIVAMDDSGKRKYVSDTTRDNWGGSVPQNFVGVYWHPKLGPPPTAGSPFIASTNTQKKTGSYNYLGDSAGIPLDIGISPIESYKLTDNSGNFNAASNQNSLSVLMLLLAAAVMGAATNGNKADLNMTGHAKPLS